MAAPIAWLRMHSRPTTSAEPVGHSFELSAEQDRFRDEMTWLGGAVVFAGLAVLTNLTALYTPTVDSIVVWVAIGCWVAHHLKRWWRGEPKTPPATDEPMSLFGGIVTLLAVVLVGVCAIVAADTGHDPIDDWGPALWTLAWGAWAAHGKVGRRMVHPYLPFVGALVMSGIVLMVGDAHSQFAIDSCLIGALLILDARSFRRNGVVRGQAG
jgi:hypothetical protein